jgi:hypothetical protein
MFSVDEDSRFQDDDDLKMPDVDPALDMDVTVKEEEVGDEESDK